MAVFPAPRLKCQDSKHSYRLLHQRVQILTCLNKIGQELSPFISSFR